MAGAVGLRWQMVAMCRHSFESTIHTFIDPREGGNLSGRMDNIEIWVGYQLVEYATVLVVRHFASSRGLGLLHLLLVLGSAWIDRGADSGDQSKILLV